MSEWFKEHDWKSCVRLKRTGGSNPLLCATKRTPLRVRFLSDRHLKTLRKKTKALPSWECFLLKIRSSTQDRTF